MNPIKLIAIAVALAIAESATNCPPGSYIVKAGVCRPCPKGSFQPRANKWACRPCQRNTIAETEGNTECTACPEGMEPHEFRHKCDCKAGSVEESGKCVKCRPGTYFQEFNNIRFCGDCYSGYFQPDAGQFECLKCPEGTMSGSGATKCVTCEDDEEFNNSGNRCDKCPAGYSMEYYGCAGCPLNTYKPKDGPGPCLPCQVGSYSDPRSANCTSCPKRTVLLQNGTCASCEAGSYYYENGRNCIKCRFNEFTQYRNVLTSCYSCSGKKFALEGSTKCVRCPKNKFLNTDGKCKHCPPGSVFIRYQLKCEKCRVNQYARSNRDYCRSCPTGSYSYPGSTTCFTCKKDESLILNENKCAKCPAGNYYDRYDAKCILCWEGSVKREPGLADCVSCPGGMTSNENRTECVPVE